VPSGIHVIRRAVVTQIIGADLLSVARRLCIAFQFGNIRGQRLDRVGPQVGWPGSRGTDGVGPRAGSGRADLAGRALVRRIRMRRAVREQCAQHEPTGPRRHMALRRHWFYEVCDNFAYNARSSKALVGIAQARGLRSMIGGWTRARLIEIAHENKEADVRSTTSGAVRM